MEVVVDEHFVPHLGLDLEPYLQQDIISGIHHLGRYYWALDVLKPYRPRRILDVACGAGYGSYLLAKTFPRARVLGGDYDPKAVESAAATYRLPNLEYAFFDVVDWKQQGQFDAIVSFDTIEHVVHREIMMQNFAENLAPAGCLLLSTPVQGITDTKPKWQHHRLEYSGHALLDFLRRYFRRVLRPEDGSLPNRAFFDRLNTPRELY